MADKIRSFRIPEDLWQRVDTVATENETSKTGVVITALEYLLERAETKNG